MKINNGKVFTSNNKFENKNILVKEQYIEKIIDCEETIKVENDDIDATDCYVVPGFIDIHFHGCMGHDFSDAESKALDEITKYQLKNGITTICPATMSYSEDILSKIMTVVSDFCTEKKQDIARAELVGINMEGPFISEKRCGAQNKDYISKPDINMFYRLQEKANGMIKLLDIAPELEGAIDLIKELKDKVRISLAHTDCDYEIANEAFENGASQVTHMYNAMNPFLSREPGVIGAACDNQKVLVEMILDGVHVHSSVARTTFKAFGDDRIILISDSMRACGMKDGQYTLGGQLVQVKGNIARLVDGGNIAGSVSNLRECVKYAYKKMNIPLESLIKCVTLNPAKAIGIDKMYGSIEIGKYANILILDKELNIKRIINKGGIYNG